jgi:DNA-binding XRE family transcriptional regulator
VKIFSEIASGQRTITVKRQRIFTWGQTMKKMQRNLMKAMRQMLGLTLGDLAKMTGISVPRLSRIERGTFAIRAEEMKVIWVALGLTGEVPDDPDDYAGRH